MSYSRQTWPRSLGNCGVPCETPVEGRRGCEAIGLIGSIELAGDSPYVFPGRWINKSLSEMAFLMLLRRLKHDDITAHGFRSTFRDWAAERTTFPTAVVEAALAHQIKDKVEAAYLRTKIFDQRRDLMNTWAAFATTPTSAAVVPIRA